MYTLIHHHYFPDTRRSIYQYFWGPKDPCPCPDKKCVIMHRTLQGLCSWKPAKCSESHHYLCTGKYDMS